MSTKELSFSVCSDFTGTALSRIDNKMEIDDIKVQLQELASLMKNNRITAQPTTQIRLETNRITHDVASFAESQVTQ